MFDAVLTAKGCVMWCFCVSTCFHPCVYVFHCVCVRVCMYVCTHVCVNVWMCDCVTVWMRVWCWTDVMCARNHVAFAVAWLDCDLTCFTCENSTSNGCLSCAGVYPYFYERTHECLMNEPVSVWCNTSNFCFGMWGTGAGSLCLLPSSRDLLFRVDVSLCLSCRCFLCM